MCETEIPHPFMRHPLLDPTLINCKCVICVAEGGNPKGGAIREFITCLAVKDWIEFEAFVKGVCDKDIDERRKRRTEVSIENSSVGP